LSRCTAIKPSGDRCRGRAIEGSEWCWNHDPAHAEQRRRHGQRGGKRGGRGRPQADLAAVKGRLRQLLNTYIRAVSVELKAREQLELIERLEALEEGLAQSRSRGGGYGA